MYKGSCLISSMHILTTHCEKCISAFFDKNDFLIPIDSEFHALSDSTEICVKFKLSPLIFAPKVWSSKYFCCHNCTFYLCSSDRAILMVRYIHNCISRYLRISSCTVMPLCHGMKCWHKCTDAPFVHFWPLWYRLMQ